MILLDTNIPTYSKQPGRPEYVRVTQKLTELIDDGEDLIICPQHLYEFYAVASRPVAQNGFGLSSDDARKEMNEIKDAYTFINDPTDLFDNWHLLIQQYKTTGKPSHDTRLVAFMQGQNINKIYTLNATDFNRYGDIITILT